MEAQEVVVEFLNNIPAHSHELGALAAELQNFLLPKGIGQDLSGTIGEGEPELFENYSPAQPTPELVHHLLARVCILLSTDEHLLWAASSRFLFQYVCRLKAEHMSRNTAQLVAFTLLASIQAKAARQLRFMLANVHCALGAIHRLWRGPPGASPGGFLTTYDLIRLFQEITGGGKAPVHFILHPLFNEVESERRALCSLLLPPGKPATCKL